MGKEGPFATSEDGGDVARLVAGRPVADAIDTWMLEKQGAGGEPMPQLGFRDPGPQELSPSRHSVLARRDLGDDQLNCPIRLSHCDS